MRPLEIDGLTVNMVMFLNTLIEKTLMYNMVVATDSADRASAIGHAKSTWSLIAATDAAMVRNSVAAGAADVLVLDTSSPWVSEDFMS